MDLQVGIKCIKNGVNVQLGTESNLVYRSDLYTFGNNLFIVANKSPFQDKVDIVFPILGRRGPYKDTKDHEYIFLDIKSAAYFDRDVLINIRSINPNLKHELFDKMMVIPECKNIFCGISNGIHEGLTFGSGKLDSMGYWEHPCPTCARHYEKSYDYEQAWPFAQEVSGACIETINEDLEDDKLNDIR